MEYTEAMLQHRDELMYATFGLKLGTADVYGCVRCLCCDAIYKQMESDGTAPAYRDAFGYGFRSAYRTDGEGDPNLENVNTARDTGVFDAEYSDFCDKYAATIY